MRQIAVPSFPDVVTRNGFYPTRHAQAWRMSALIRDKI
jgi:hypothetical protein